MTPSDRPRTDAELKALAEDASDGDWLSHDESVAVAKAYLALLAEKARLIARRMVSEYDPENIAARPEKAQRGEVVDACPRCSAHEPEWLPDAGCWHCDNCMAHLDAVDHWQRIPPPVEEPKP